MLSVVCVTITIRSRPTCRVSAGNGGVSYLGRLVWVLGRQVDVEYEGAVGVRRVRGGDEEGPAPYAHQRESYDEVRAVTYGKVARIAPYTYLNLYLCINPILI